jgi:hypothetical protein
VCNARPHSLRNQIALKLSHSPHDVKQQLTARSSGIDALGIADEVNVEGTELRCPSVKAWSLNAAAGEKRVPKRNETVEKRRGKTRPIVF